MGIIPQSAVRSPQSRTRSAAAILVAIVLCVGAGTPAPALAASSASSGISTEILAAFAKILQTFQSFLASQHSIQISGGGAAVAPAYSGTWGLSQRIDSLTNTAINTPTITGGTISSATVSGTLSGTFSGTSSFTSATTASLAISSIPWGLLSTDGLGNIVATSTPTAAAFTATSTTATSTFAGGFTVGTNNLIVNRSTGFVGIGTTAPDYRLDVAGTANVQTLRLPGGTSGSVALKAPAVAGGNTITFPAGTTDFSATGGASKFVRQNTLGGALDVVQPAFSDISGQATLPQLPTLGANTVLCNATGVSATPTACSHETINVKDFKTGGSGTVADPYTGWDTAITWSAGKTYFFAPGVFSFGTLNITVPVTLVGSGYSTLMSAVFGDAGWLTAVHSGTVLKSTATSGNAITFNNTSNSYAYGVRDLMLLGPGTGTSTGVALGTTGRASLHNRWDNVLVANFSKGASFINVEDSEFASLVFNGNTTGLELGLNTNQNVFTNLQLMHATAGATIVNASLNAFYGGLAQDVTTGFVISGNSTAVKGFWGEAVTDLFKIDSTSVGVKNLSIENCRSSATNFITFVGTSTVNYLGLIQNEWGGGVTIPSHATNALLLNNEFISVADSGVNTTIINSIIGRPVSLGPGINQAPPANTVLHVGGANSATPRVVIDTFAQPNELAFRAAAGTAATPTALVAGNDIGSITAWGRGATGYGTSARGRFLFSAGENWTDAAQGTYASIYTTPNGSLTPAERLRITNDGKVGIGTGSPATLLHVNGSDTATSVTIQGQLSISTSRNALAQLSLTDTAAGGHTWYLGSISGAGSFDFRDITAVGAPVRVTIDGAGNVGIGTTSPSTTFGIVGSEYLTGGLGVGTLNTTAGTLQTSGAATIGGLGIFSSGFLSNSSSTITSGLFSANGGASTTNITASGTGYFATASTTNLTVSGIQSSLITTSATGVASAYAGSTCTNQFVRSLNGAGVATCAAASLTADVTGILPIANGGTATSTQVTNGVNFFDGTKITSGSTFVFNGTNVGIATTTPSHPLTISNASKPQLALTDASASSNEWTFRNAGGTLYIATSTYSATSSVSAFTLDANGNLTIVGSATTCTIGNGTLATNCSSSDERLKDDVAPLAAESGLAAIQALNPVSFRWNPWMQGMGNASSTQFGLIAQEVRGVFPNLVQEDPNTHYYKLDYQGLIAPIVKAIQELDRKLSILTDTVGGFAERFTTKELVATNITADNITANKTLCVGSTCLTEDQIKTLLAAVGQTAASARGDTSTGGAASGTSTPPVIEINGANPAIIQVGDTYADLGAQIIGQQEDLNLGVLTFLNGIKTDAIQLDTSTASTSTIDYVVTDSFGQTATATRVVIVE